MEKSIPTYQSLHKITSELIKPVFSRVNHYWRMAFFSSLILFCIGLYSAYVSIFHGIGSWGLNRTVGWGWGITNFVWWIGIGHAGTFISAILLLFQQRWRTSINRAAESMTIIAILCAAIFPIIHMGRQAIFFFTFPYPNTRNLWLNFNSPLVWDVFAISTYFLVSLMFWYVGLIPDLASIRDKATNPLKKHVYKILSMGWVGKASHWLRFETLNFYLAALAAPLVLSVHSIVSMDFATSLIPGWHSTIFPPYFVAGAIFSGFAMVQTLLIITRRVLQIEHYITIRHMELMNKIILITGSLVALAYFSEFIMAFLSGNEYEMFVFKNRLTGNYSYAFSAMIIFNVCVPQLLWIRKIRRHVLITFILSIAINVGMWFERFVIVVSSISKDFISARWADYKPSFIEVGLFLGTIGFFLASYLLFIRIFPIVSIAEIKANQKGDSNGED